MEVEVHRLTRPRKASWSVAPEIASFKKQKKRAGPPISPFYEQDKQ
jgi:hypothetical protein